MMSLEASRRSISNGWPCLHRPPAIKGYAVLCQPGPSGPHTVCHPARPRAWWQAFLTSAWHHPPEQAPDECVLAVLRVTTRRCSVQSMSRAPARRRSCLERYTLPPLVRRHTTVDAYHNAWERETCGNPGTPG